MAKARIVRNTEGEVATGGDIPWIFKIGGGTGGAFDFMVGDIPHLSGPPLHIHRDQHDTFYILDGVLAIQVGDEVLDLGPGDFATVPPGLAHTFDNIRDDRRPVRALNVMTPGGLDRFLADIGALGAAVGDAALGQVAAEHGIAFVGPPLRVKLGLASR